VKSWKITIHTEKRNSATTITKGKKFESSPFTRGTEKQQRGKKGRGKKFTSEREHEKGEKIVDPDCVKAPRIKKSRRATKGDEKRTSPDQLCQGGTVGARNTNASHRDAGIERARNAGAREREERKNAQRG